MALARTPEGLDIKFSLLLARLVNRDGSIITSEDLKRVCEKQEELRKAIENDEILMALPEKHDFATRGGGIRETNEWLKNELREINEWLKNARVKKEIKQC